MNQAEESRAGAPTCDQQQHPDHYLHSHHPPPKFAVDDKVYCVQHQHHASPASKEDRSSARRRSSYHYEAVVRQSKYDFSSGTWLYLIHYLGWNHRWDEWMDVTQLLTPSEYQQLDDQQLDEQQSQQENSNNHSAESAENYDHTNTTAAGATAVALASSNANNNNTAGHKRHRMNDPNPPSANYSMARKRARTVRQSSNHSPTGEDGAWTYAEYCELPLTLQTVLVEERERLTTTTNLPWVHTLPAAVPVSKVLQHFVKKKCKELGKQQEQQSLEKTNRSGKTNPAMTSEGVQSFVESLAQLFNEALSTCLLYPQERPQYEAWRLQQQHPSQPNDGTPSSSLPVDCYGCEYLLRLLVRLPILLHPTTTTPSQQQHHRMVGSLLTELIVLLQKNRSALFAATTNYRRPAPHEAPDGEQKPLPPPRLESMMDTTQ